MFFGDGFVGELKSVVGSVVYFFGYGYLFVGVFLVVFVDLVCLVIGINIFFVFFEDCLFMVVYIEDYYFNYENIMV